MKITMVSCTPTAEELIGRCAAICYDSRTDTEACIKRAASCKEKGHLATLRFAHATFHITGISRVCSHQLVRSKHLDFLQRSQRYVEEGSAGHVYPPAIAGNAVAMSIYRDALNQSVFAYDELRKLGIKKEDARFVLPQATETELYVTGNFQAWQDFIKLRGHKAAQEEIRKVAIEISRQLNLVAPHIFDKEIDCE